MATATATNFMTYEGMAGGVWVTVRVGMGNGILGTAQTDGVMTFKRSRCAAGDLLYMAGIPFLDHFRLGEWHFDSSWLLYCITLACFRMSMSLVL